MDIFGKHRADDAALAARYKHLLAVAKTLARERDLKKVLTLTMDTIVELTGAERAFVWLGGPEEGRVPVARNIDKESIRRATDKVSRSILRRAMESRETVLTDNATEEFESRSIADMKLRSVLCAPLIASGSAISPLRR